MKATLVLLVVIFPATCIAGSSASADYAVTTDVLDAGGQKSTSAGYANDGSIGTIGRFTTLGAYNSRGGFPGQLYELTNLLQVNLSPATIGEGVSLQLGVQAVADDTTRVDLAATDVIWTSTGPVSISASGLATGGAVYESTSATATATRGTATGNLALSILDTLEDNYGLYANDGIIDDWQITHFGVDSPDGLATADPDDDTQDNMLEFLAETEPDDPASRFRLRIENVPGKPEQKVLTFSPYSTKRSYAVEWTSLFDKWFDLVSFTEGDAGPEHYFIDHDAKEDAKFYRIKISL